LDNKITKGSPLVFIYQSYKNITEEDNKYNNKCYNNLRLFVLSGAFNDPKSIISHFPYLGFSPVYCVWLGLVLDS
jgi:hypothetical protein